MAYTTGLVLLLAAIIGAVVCGGYGASGHKTGGGNGGGVRIGGGNGGGVGIGVGVGVGLGQNLAGVGVGPIHIGNSVISGVGKIEDFGTYGPWSAWKACSKTCGGGRQGRWRTCNKPDIVVGKFAGCRGPKDQHRDCNTQACPPPPGTYTRYYGNGVYY